MQYGTPALTWNHYILLHNLLDIYGRRILQACLSCARLNNAWRKDCLSGTQRF